MNANDIIEKCARVCEQAGEEIDEGSLTASRIASECAGIIRALKSTYAPGMTDMMVSPESLDEFMAANPLPDEKDSRMTSEQIKHLVDRFLQWRLPEDFNPDNGISYKRPNYAAEVDATPSGTNLFDAAQATDMVRFMVEGMPASSLPDETVSEAKVEDLMQTAIEAYDNVYNVEYFVDGITDNHQTAMRAAVEAVLEAAAPAPADDGWRPIETAPRDGTWVLLAGPSGCSTTPLRVEVCRWYPEYRPRNPWQNHSNDAFTDGGESPTHWRPLPAPPTDGRK